MKLLRVIWYKVFGQPWCVFRLNGRFFGWGGELYVGNTDPETNGLRLQVVWHDFGGTGPGLLEIEALIGMLHISLSAGRTVA